MKKTFSFGLLTIGLVMLVGMLRTKHTDEKEKSFSKKLFIFDSINDNPIGI